MYLDGLNLQYLPEIAIDPAQFAVPASDWSAYGAANPDVADWAQGAVQGGHFGALDDAYTHHYAEHGRGEGRLSPSELAAQTFAVETPRTGGSSPNPPVAESAVMHGPEQTAVAGVLDDVFGRTPAQPLAVPNAPGTPDFGLYSRSAGEYVDPALQPANERFSTPYYAAYTNDGDLAGAVMVADGQRIRLMDSKTGDVVFEGTGPDAARQAVGIANAVSEDRGRKAAWSIQADTGDGRGWVTQAYERYDPKKSGLFGTLMDIAAPIVLNALLPGLGGALAGALGTFGGTAAFHSLANLGSGLVQGESLRNAGVGALGAGLTAGVVNGALTRVPGLDNAVGSVMRPVNDFAVNAVDAIPGARLVLDPINNGLVHVIGAGGQVLGSVTGTIDSVRTSIQNAVGLGGGSPSATPDIGGLGGTVAPVDIIGNPFSVDLPGVSLPFGGGSGSDGLTGDQGGDRLSEDDNEVEALDVPGIRPPVIPTPVITPVDPFGVEGLRPVDDGFEPPTEETEVDPVDVVAQLPPQTPGVVTPPDFGVPTPTIPTLSPPPTPPPPPSETPATPVTTAPPGGPVLPGQPTPVRPTSPFSPGGVGTRASLSPIFSAQLPPPTFGVRTPQAVDIDQRYAIERPEASFFTQVPQAPGPSRFAVPTPNAVRLQGVGDLNADGLIDEDDLTLWRRRYGGQGYAVGGGVSGRGSGRSDEIDARLSDGEYVIDAETVALLGDGSSRAGADRLDKFRVAVRKHKGRDLAAGRFSVAAKPAAAYLEGR